MKQLKFLPGSYVHYLGHIYEVIWNDGDRIRIGIPGTVYPGYWMPTGTLASLKPTHWTLSVSNPFLAPF